VALDPETLFLVLISGSVGAVLGGVAGAFVAGHYAVVSARKQILREIKQETYTHALRSLNELIDVTTALSRVVQVDPNDTGNAIANLSELISPVSYFAGDEAYDKAFQRSTGEAINLTDPEQLNRITQDAKRNSVRVLSHHLVRLSHAFHHESFTWDLAQPSDDVTSKFKFADDSLVPVSVVLSMRINHLTFGNVPDPGEAEVEKRVATALAALDALKKAMIADLSATLG
jgi:hypothetical protein